MAESFTPCRHAWWPSIASGLSGEWSREAAMMDLRWHADEARVFGRSFPSRSMLVARWGWTDKRVRVLLASPEWVDPFNPTTVADLRGEPKGQARASRGPAEGQEGANGERLEADTFGERASEGPMKGRQWADEGPHARVLHHPPAPTPSTSEDSAPASGAGTLTPAGTSSRPADGQDRTAIVNAPSTAASPASRGPSPTEAASPTMTTATHGPTATDSPPPPSDEDYYASETSEGAAEGGSAPGVDLRVNAAAFDGGHSALAQGRSSTGAVSTPPAPHRRTAAVDQGAEVRQVRAADPAPDVVHGRGAGRVGGGGTVPALRVDPVAGGGLFATLAPEGPSSASTGASHATAPAEGVGAKGGVSGRGKRTPKPPAEPKPVPVANRLIGEWLASHLEAHGEAYVITPVCAKKLRELVKDEPADADLSGWRAAFDAFNRKGFGDFPKGFTAMGFAIDPPRWRQQARAEVAGISTAARNGRPVAPSYEDTRREIEEMERAMTRNGTIDAAYEVLQ